MREKNFSTIKKHYFTFSDIIWYHKKETMAKAYDYLFKLLLIGMFNLISLVSIWYIFFYLGDSGVGKVYVWHLEICLFFFILRYI
jgi:hypothetical protein